MKKYTAKLTKSTGKISLDTWYRFSEIDLPCRQPKCMLSIPQYIPSLVHDC